jgi:hypothetical protein
MKPKLVIETFLLRLRKAGVTDISWKRNEEGIINVKGTLPKFWPSGGGRRGHWSYLPVGLVTYPEYVELKNPKIRYKEHKGYKIVDYSDYSVVDYSKPRVRKYGKWNSWGTAMPPLSGYKGWKCNYCKKRFSNNRLYNHKCHQIIGAL